MRHRVDGDVALLHALEQARLRLRARAVDLVDDHDVGEDRPGAELEAALALVVDVGARRCRRAAGRPCTARARTGTRSSARARGRARSCRRRGSPRRARGPPTSSDTIMWLSCSSRTFTARRMFSEIRCAIETAAATWAGARLSSASGVGSTGSISAAPSSCVDERSLKSMSRMAPATSALAAVGTCASPVGGDDDDLVLGGCRSRSPGRETSLSTTASRPLRSSFPRACASAPSPCSAAKPIRTWPGRRAAASAESTSSVRSSRRFSSSGLVLLELAGVRGGRAVVGDGGGHQQHVGVGEAALGAPRRARRRWSRRRTRSRRGAAARRWRRSR